jgi:hypothetical protein
MTVTLKFITRARNTKRKREVEVIIEVGNTVPYSFLKELWNVEQLLNGLPETDTRVHVSIEN